MLIVAFVLYALRISNILNLYVKLQLMFSELFLYYLQCYNNFTHTILIMSQIWSCRCCFTTLHLQCIQRWAREACDLARYTSTLSNEHFPNRLVHWTWYKWLDSFLHLFERVVVTRFGVCLFVQSEVPQRHSGSRHSSALSVLLRQTHGPAIRRVAPAAQLRRAVRPATRAELRPSLRSQLPSRYSLMYKSTFFGWTHSRLSQSPFVLFASSTLTPICKSAFLLVAFSQAHVRRASRWCSARASVASRSRRCVGARRGVGSARRPAARRSSAATAAKLPVILVPCDLDFNLTFWRFSLDRSRLRHAVYCKYGYRSVTGACPACPRNSERTCACGRHRKSLDCAIGEWHCNDVLCFAAS